MSGDLNTRIIITARDDASRVFLETANNLSVVSDAARKTSDALGGSMSTEVVARKTAELAGNLSTISRLSQAAGKDIGALGAQFESLASQAGLTGKEYASLQERMLRTQASRQASESLRAVADAAGLSSREVEALGRKMGMARGEIAAADRSAQSVATRFTLLEGVAGRLAVVLGAVGLAALGKEAALAAARYDTLGVVMEVVGRNAGISRQVMDETSKSLQRQGIAMVESRDATVRLTQAGIDLAQTNRLGRIAQDAAVIGQMNSSQAFMTMISAIQTAQPEMLRTIGIVVNFEDAYRQYAAQVNKSADSLSEQEKMQARVNAVLLAGGKITGTYEAAMATAGKQIGSLASRLDDLKTVGGEALQEGLAASVALATEKVKEFTAYLKTDEARAQIAAIGKTGEESFATLVSAAEKAGSFLSVVSTGWNSLPDIVKEAGLVVAVVGGPRAVAALGVLSAAVGETRKLMSEIGDIWGDALGDGDDARLRVLERNKKGISSSWLLSDSGKAYQIHQVDKQIQEIKGRRRSLEAERAMLNDSVAAPPAKPYNPNTKPVVEETWGDLVSQRSRLFSGGGESSLSDQTRRDKALADFKGRYELSLRMYALAGGDSKKMADAVAVERDAHHALGAELDSIDAKRKRAGDSARKAAYEISESMNSALAASEGWLGTKWDTKFRQLLVDQDKALKSAKTPVEEYWAKWEYGAKRAQAEFDRWIDSIKRSGDVMSELGSLSMDPSMQFEGERRKLAASWEQAVKEAAGNQEEIDRINKVYSLKEVDLRERTMGDMSKLDASYWARRREGLENMDRYLAQQGADEHARAVYLSQERAKLGKQELEARLGYEATFSAYLEDRLALHYELYKDAAARQLELWEGFADAVIGALDGITDAVSNGVGSALGDAVQGSMKSAQYYLEQGLKSFGQTLASSLSEVSRMALRHYIVVPIFGQIVGTGGSFGGLASSSGLNVQGGDGAFGLESLMKYAGLGKDAAGLFGSAGGMSLEALSAASTNAFTSTLSSSGSVQMANVAASNATSAAGGGLTAALGPAALAGGLGYLAGGMVRSDTRVPSYTGAGAGIIAGGAAALAGLSTLAATGVGALVAIPAAIATGLAMGETKKSTWTVPAGSRPAIYIAGGDVVPASYGILKTTATGAFGSTRSSSNIVYTPSSGAMLEQQQAAWTSATTAVARFARIADVSGESLKAAQSQFFTGQAIPVPEGMDAEVYKNIANAFAITTANGLGLYDALMEVADSSETTIDVMTRLSDAWSVAAQVAMVTGTDLRDLYASIDSVKRADKISQLEAAVGGADAFSQAFAMANTGRLNTEIATGQVAAARRNLDETLARLDPEGGDAQNVASGYWWTHYRNSLAMPDISPERFSAMTQIAAAVQAWEASVKAGEGVALGAKEWDSSMSSRLLTARGDSSASGLISLQVQQERELAEARWAGATAAQLATLAEVQAAERAAYVRDSYVAMSSAVQEAGAVMMEMAQGTRGAADSLAGYRTSLLLDSSLSTLSDSERVAVARSAYDDVLTRARGGEVEALGMMETAGRDYLTALRAGGTADEYQAAFVRVAGDISTLQTTVARDMGVAQLQLEALRSQNAISQEQYRLASEAVGFARSDLELLAAGQSMDAASLEALRRVVDASELAASGQDSLAESMHRYASVIADALRSAGVPVTAFASGGVQTPWGPARLVQPGRGGVAYGPSVSVFGEGSGAEAYVPLSGGAIPVHLSTGSLVDLLGAILAENKSLRRETSQLLRAVESHTARLRRLSEDREVHGMPVYIMEVQP